MSKPVITSSWGLGGLGGKICVRAHASSANLGPGFDAVSVALEAFEDVVCVAVEENSKGVIVDRVWGPYADGVEYPGSVVKAVEKLLELTGTRRIGVVVEVYKGIPVSRGLGSSGASAAAAVVAVNSILGLGADKHVLVEAAGYGETASAGTPHYDNVAASLLGGLVVVAPGNRRFHILSLPVKAFFALAVPLIEPIKEKTSVMRSVLPSSVELGRAVKQWQRAVMLISALYMGDYKLAGEMMMLDEIVEPARAPYVPCYEGVRRAAIEAGAYGVALSGAGPSMIALVPNSKTAGYVAREMARAFSDCGIRAEPYVSGVGGPAEVVEERSVG